jgi:hypothetical protein
MYIGPTPQAMALMEVWIRLCELEPEIWEQKLLQRLVEAREPAPFGFGHQELRTVPNLNVFRLPVSYCQIFDHPNNGDSVAVIEHMQASRKLKDRVTR